MIAYRMALVVLVQATMSITSKVMHRMLHPSSELLNQTLTTNIDNNHHSTETNGGIESFECSQASQLHEIYKARLVYRTVYLLLGYSQLLYPMSQQFPHAFWINIVLTAAKVLFQFAWSKHSLYESEVSFTAR
jgi:hypothetical protein